MLRCFDSDEIVHVEETVDPVRDLEMINKELILKDLEKVNALWEKTNTLVTRGIDKTKKTELEYLTKIQAALNDGRMVRCVSWTNKEVEYLNTLLLLTAKPQIYLCNMSKKDYLSKKNKYLPKVKKWIDDNTNEVMIPFSAEFEAEMREMPDDERDKFLEEHKTKIMMPKIITQGFHSLNLQYFFTCGNDEVRAWTVQKGTKAPQAAGRIHTDFEKGFVCLEVMNFTDWKEHGSEAACRAAGKYRQQGREYEVQDGDIVLVRANTGGGLKKK
eukprot:Sspe_Gene.41894::Locus_20274_Transcript_2_4_Confidence_0.400_Length_1288::g.41894::m.41894/K19788/OLA1; obg-like ATPase 1